MSTPFDCQAELQKLWDTYVKVVSDPNTVVRIRKGEREVEYSGLNLKALERLYMIHWNMCGAACGLPAIGTNAHIQRGPAAAVYFK